MILDASLSRQPCRCSSMAEHQLPKLNTRNWQSVRLLTEGLEVRVLPGEQGVRLELGLSRLLCWVLMS